MSFDVLKNTQNIVYSETFVSDVSTIINGIDKNNNSLFFKDLIAIFRDEIVNIKKEEDLKSKIIIGKKDLSNEGKIFFGMSDMNSASSRTAFFSFKEFILAHFLYYNFIDEYDREIIESIYENKTKLIVIDDNQYSFNNVCDIFRSVYFPLFYIHQFKLEDNKQYLSYKINSENLKLSLFGLYITNLMQLRFRGLTANLFFNESKFGLLFLLVLSYIFFLSSSTFLNITLFFCIYALLSSLICKFCISRGFNCLYKFIPPNLYVSFISANKNKLKAYRYFREIFLFLIYFYTILSDFLKIFSVPIQFFCKNFKWF